MLAQPYVQPTVATRKPSRFERAYDGFGLALPFAYLFTLLTLAITAIEVARILTGSLNRSPTFSYMLYPGNIYIPPNFNENSTAIISRQNNYLWPWSHPALLATLPLLAASIFGFAAARRATYSMIYLFYALSLFLFAISPFLIAYFSSVINLHNRGATNYRNNAFAHRDRSLAIVMLILSLILFVTSFLSMIVTALTFSCCRTKGGGYLNSPRRHAFVPMGNMNRAIVPTY